MRLMDIQAIYPRRSSSAPGKGHTRYPYLLRNLPIKHVNQVWSADITYVLAWRLSNTLEGIVCLEALRQALSKGRPKIFNTDQGAQFTADAFTACLLTGGIQVIRDGAAAPSTTSSANDCGAASNMRKSIFNSMK